MTAVGDPPTDTGEIDAGLARVAEQLGVAVSYTDADDHPARSSAGAVRAVVDLLGVDARRGGPGASPTSAVGSTGPAIDDVVLVRGGRLRSGVPATVTETGATVRLDVDHDDAGTSVLHDGPGHDLDGAPGWAELPIGLHRLRWRVDGQEGESTLLVAPRRFPVPRRDRPGRALFAPIYSVWTDAERDPAYDTLAELGTAVRRFGVDTIATLPLYAPGLGDGFDPSPYSPVSRFHWNELFVPARLLPPVADGVDGQGAVPADRVDWDGVLARRVAQLDAVARSLDDTDRAALDRYLAGRPMVASYAAFLAEGDPGAERRHVVGQWLAERAVVDATRALASGGQTLALDLPVGARAGSWETWRWPELFVPGAQIGAPPDTFFRGGQNWGLPPLNPVASRRDGHRVWHDLLTFACRHAGVLRIDHVMQVHRLWWIPDGHPADDGAYVRYPADELLAVAAIVAHRTGTVVVGENLGTVPDVMSRLLRDWGLIGMYEEAFTAHWFADDPPPEELERVPPDTWAGIRTHDMAPLARLVDDIDTSAYRAELGAELGRTVSADPVELGEAMTERLVRGATYEVVVDLDDVLGIADAHNVPGTIGPHNWSRRHVAPIGELTDDVRFDRLLGGTAPTTADDHEGTP